MLYDNDEIGNEIIAFVKNPVISRIREDFLLRFFLAGFKGRCFQSYFVIVIKATGYDETL